MLRAVNIYLQNYGDRDYNSKAKGAERGKHIPTKCWSPGAGDSDSKVWGAERGKHIPTKCWSPGAGGSDSKVGGAERGKHMQTKYSLKSLCFKVN